MLLIKNLENYTQHHNLSKQRKPKNNTSSDGHSQHMNSQAVSPANGHHGSSEHSPNSEVHSPNTPSSNMLTKQVNLIQVENFFMRMQTLK